MRTRLFRSFLLIILIALFSSIVFQRLMVRDFDLYVESVREDQLRWVLASVESSFVNEQWNLDTLTESLHWAMMLGIDAAVVGNDGREILASRKAISSLPENMLRHMEHLFHLEASDGPYAEYPLVLENRKIGVLFYRPFPKKEIMEKEKDFKENSESFLYIALAIAGGGALFLAVLLTRHLRKPLLRMMEAADRIARGDFSARIRLPGAMSATSPDQRSTKAERADEIVSLAESFNFMAGSLQREETLRRNLLSNISHELRTPLTIMKAHIEALEDGILEEPGATLKTIKAESEKLIDLIRGIEDLTLAEADFMKPGQFNCINLREFFAGLMREQLPLMKEKNLTLEMVRDSDLVVAADVEKLEKVVRNLLSNSAKFTREGGVIRMDYGKEGETFYVEVKDTGVGIPESEIPLIFNRFYRAERSGPAGSGLGLAIVKEAVAAMGGRIEVKSKIGEGTAFRIHLPIDPACKYS